jgi:hypothetical protein
MRRAASGLPLPPWVKTTASTPERAVWRVSGFSRSPVPSSAPGRSRSARAGSRTSAYVESVPLGGGDDAAADAAGASDDEHGGR